MGYGAPTPVKVDRVKLIEKLKERAAEREKKIAGQFKEDLAKAVKSAEAEVKNAQEHVTRLKAVKVIDDLREGDYWRHMNWARDYRSDNTDFKRVITALELSTEETITIKADSNLYRYL